MNMTRAAEMLHVAQPSISSAIKSLEEEVGFEFFDRSRRQLKLTDKGRLFLDRSKSLLNHVEDVSKEMKDLGGSNTGTIKLGIPPMIGTLLFPRILIDYKKEYPYIQLQLSEDGSLETKRKIIDGEIDLGIIILSDEEEALETKQILKTEIVACMNRAHSLGRHSKLSPELIAKEKLIMLKEGFYHREVLLSYFNETESTQKLQCLRIN